MDTAPVSAAAGDSRESRGYRLGLDALDAEVETDLEVVGALPPWLGGTLVRNGAGRWTARPGGAGRPLQHWFDGLAMLQRFTFGASGGSSSSSTVAYANRYLRSPARERMEATGDLGFAEFATVPRVGVLERVRAALAPPAIGSNACVNVLAAGGRHVALTETAATVPFDPLTLASAEPLAWEDDVPGVTTTAHPHVDPDGTVVNVTTEIGRRCHHHVTEVAPGTWTRRVVATVGTDAPSYQHSFAATERHVVLVEHPMVIAPLSLAAGRSFFDSLRWRPRRGTRFTVVDRADGRVVVRSTTDAAFSFHQVNAFEEDGGAAVLVDLPVMPGQRAMSQFLRVELLGDGARTPTGELRRYRVPLDGAPVTHRLLSTQALEFPRIVDAAAAGRPYRRAYGVGTPGSSTTTFADRLVAVDVQDGGALVWREDGCWPGEPVPVAAPGAATGAEDDGVVLSVVLDSRAARSFLLVLDAATLTEVARAWLPHAVPHGFHGQHFPGAVPG